MLSKHRKDNMDDGSSVRCDLLEPLLVRKLNYSFVARKEFPISCELFILHQIQPKRLRARTLNDSTKARSTKPNFSHLPEPAN
jgi:hypothetical protein